MCIFNAVKKQPDIGFIVDALFGNFANLNSLHTVIELHTNFVLIHFGKKNISSHSSMQLQIRRFYYFNHLSAHPS